MRSESPKGRGAANNPVNRFERLAYTPDPECDPEESPDPRTIFLRDTSRSVIARNDSPDVGFGASVNPYRGCEHGCAYCYARPTHEYLGFSAGLDFETRILVKEDAPELLRGELSSPRWEPEVLALCGVTDAYQPVERRLGLTRRCLQVLAEFRNPVGIVTKNHLVTRDADVLAELASHQAACVTVSMTSLDPALARDLEPRASAPHRRLEAIELLAAAGVPVGVNVAPIIPGLNDHEMPAIVQAAASRGAGFAGYTIVRLPYGVAEIFEAWLERHRPGLKAKVLSQIRSMRKGRLNDPRFGSRMRGQGPFAAHVKALFRLACRRAGLLGRYPELSTDAFLRPQAPQLELF